MDAARDERAAALREILSQDVEFISDFMGVLTITPGSHPNTFRVLHIASLIGSFAALYFKGLRNRPRPSQLCPALLPPVPVPGHSSWPSGHATQARLMARCIERVLQQSTMSPTDAAFIATDLKVLAGRVARNREIAGLHYESDSKAGCALANALFGTLTGTSAPSRFVTAVNAAKDEWS